MAGIVDEDNEIFLVKEGDVFANRYRALKVFPASILVAEAAALNDAPPAETVREFDGQFTAGLGVPTGLSPPDDVTPTAPAVKHERVAISKPQSGPRLSNAARLPASRASPAPKARPNLLASARARAPAKEGTGPPPASLPITLTPLGYVEKANGEVQAIVVQNDQVCLVRQGDFFAHQYKAVSVSASAVVAVLVSPAEAANQASAEIFGRGQLSSATPFAATFSPPPEVVQPASPLPEGESSANGLSGSGRALPGLPQAVGLPFPFSASASPNSPP
jgi:hypothetical protein